jgi:hypothetical protein
LKLAVSQVTEFCEPEGPASDDAERADRFPQFLETVKNQLDTYKAVKRLYGRNSPSALQPARDATACSLMRHSIGAEPGAARSSIRPGDQDNPHVPVHCRMRAFDRDLIRGGHYGHVNRTNTNTWLHRPAKRVKIFQVFQRLKMEHQTTRDTTSGRPKPLGARGANMADTVGSAQD